MRVRGRLESKSKSEGEGFESAANQLPPGSLQGNVFSTYFSKNTGSIPAFTRGGGFTGLQSQWNGDMFAFVPEAKIFFTISHHIKSDW